MVAAPYAGLRITPEEVKARWTYSELGSVRWKDDRKHEYRLLADDPLLLARASGRQFHELESELITRLHQNSSHAVGRLTAYLGHFPSFVCEGWSKEQIENSWVVPALNPTPPGPAPFLEMLNGPVDNPETHPIAAANRIEGRGVSPVLEPPVVIPIAYGSEVGSMLLDGTTRAILFVRGDSDTVLVWKGEGATPIQL